MKKDQKKLSKLDGNPDMYPQKIVYNQFTMQQREEELQNHLFNEKFSSFQQQGSASTS